MSGEKDLNSSGGTSREKDREKRGKLVHAVTTGVFLIGLAILFYLDALWPWILALLGVVAILGELLKPK